MSFIQAYILQPPVWMFDEKLTAKLEIMVVGSSIAFMKS